MFPSIAPEVVVGTVAEDHPNLVERGPGWTLLAASRMGGSRGVLGWHLVKAHGPWGLQYALCGVTGRTVFDDESRIVHCSGCEAQA